MALQYAEQQSEGQRAMDQQIAVSLTVAGIVLIEMDRVRIERQRREAEQQGRGG